MPVGCIVKKDSNIETFDDLIVQIIKEHKLFSREKAFDFLLPYRYGCIGPAQYVPIPQNHAAGNHPGVIQYLPFHAGRTPGSGSPGRRRRYLLY